MFIQNQVIFYLIFLTVLSNFVGQVGFYLLQNQWQCKMFLRQEEVYSATTWKKIIQSQRFLKTKDSEAFLQTDQ